MERQALLDGIIPEAKTLKERYGLNGGTINIRVIPDTELHAEPVTL